MAFLSCGAEFLGVVWISSGGGAYLPWANSAARAAYPPLADSGRPAMNPCLDGWRVRFIRAEMKGYMGGAFL